MKNNKTIISMLPFSKQQQDSLQKMAPDCHFHWLEPGGLTDELLDRAHVILGGIAASKFRSAPRLEWLQIESAGVDRYIAAGPSQNGAILTNATGAYGPAIAEHMLAMLLFLQKNFHLYRDQQKQNLWQPRGTVQAVTGSTALVVGLGDIGSEFARRLKALGSRVIGIKRSLTAKPDFVDALHTMADLESLLPQADVVALSLPGTEKTKQLMDHNRLSLLKKSAILLNVGRGTAIDTDALADLLLQGQLAGAGLDVTDPEPLPADHKLWQIQNVLITPHVSGGYSLQITLDRILALALDNFARYLQDQPLVNTVDFARGY